jgi:biopolymer transport protein ExbB/TolQ
VGAGEGHEVGILADVALLPARCAALAATLAGLVLAVPALFVAVVGANIFTLVQLKTSQAARGEESLCRKF